MKVRRCRYGEEGVLRQLCRDTTRHINGRDYTARQIDSWTRRGGTEQDWIDRVRANDPLVAERDGRILGFAELQRDGKISAFYTHHECQRQGVGRALYRAVEADAALMAIDAVHVEASKSARPFFEGMGFEVVETNEFQDSGAPVKNFIMTKKIGARRKR